MRIFSFNVFLLIFALSCNGFTKPSNLDDKIKSCMAEIYLNQVSHHKKNQRYTDQLADLSIQQNGYCKDTQITLKEASESTFKAEVKENKNVWVVDSSKTMTKLR